MPDAEQDEMTALVVDVCDRCGNLRSVCYLTAAVEQTYRQTNKRFGHPDPDDSSPHEADGLQWWASVHDLTPEDDFFGEAALLARTVNQGLAHDAEGHNADGAAE